MKYRKVSVEHRDLINRFLIRENRKLCEYCFTDIFLWKDKYRTEFCIEDDILYMRQYNKNENMYYYYVPMSISGKLNKGIANIIFDSIDNKYNFVFGGLNKELVRRIEELFPETFEFEKMRDYCDYIYSSDNLIKLSGRKYHKKKNLVNKFMREYENRWKYKDISGKDKKCILDFNKTWCEKNNYKNTEDFIDETRAIELALDNFDKLKMKGGILLVDNEIIAYTLGSESIDDVFVIQIEKAMSDYIGAYQMINNVFAINNLDKYKYINREEDLGIEGLRKAKLSYNPIILEDYYIARVRRLNIVKLQEYKKGIVIND